MNISKTFSVIHPVSVEINRSVQSSLKHLKVKSKLKENKSKTQKDGLELRIENVLMICSFISILGDCVFFSVLDKRMH